MLTWPSMHILISMGSWNSYSRASESNNLVFSKLTSRGWLQVTNPFFRSKVFDVFLTLIAPDLISEKNSLLSA